MTILQEGALARVTEDVTDPEGNFRHKGFEFTIEDYVNAEESEDDRAFYWGSTSQGYNNVTMWADTVEEAKSAEQMRNRKIPTVKEMVKHIGMSVHDSNDTFEVDETDYSQDDIVEICGETHEGLRFVSYVKVLTVEHADF